MSRLPSIVQVLGKDSQTLLYALPLSILSLFSLNYLFSVFSRRRHPFPPGPPSKPIIGNILSVKPQGGWYELTNLKAKYGDLVFFHGLGNTILSLNSMKAIEDLLDKRGGIYSNRPVFTVVSELMGLGRSMALLPYGSEWREQRKLAHVALSPSAIKKYIPAQEEQSALLNQALLDDPENFFSYVRLTAGRIVLAVTYGLNITDPNDPHITHAEDTMIVIGKATVPGAFLCDLMPFLKHLPSWVPFQKEAKIGKEMIEKLVFTPIKFVKEQMAEGIAPPSLAQHLLSNSTDALTEHRITWATGSMYGAGGETTYATVLSFMIAMALNPDKQKLGQAEIDRVVGEDRVPGVADRPDLPYVNAMIKEVMRLFPALPLGLARMSGEDDEYNGYHIPKGTIVLPNVWSIAFQPNEKYDPKKYLPERFMDVECPTVDPASWAFGFGRRICPGRGLAENSLFLIISSFLAVFDILPPLGEELKPTFGPNLVSYPEPFKCRVVPRSQRAAELIRERTAHFASH